MTALAIIGTLIGLAGIIWFASWYESMSEKIRQATPAVDVVQPSEPQMEMETDHEMETVTF